MPQDTKAIHEYKDKVPTKLEQVLAWNPNLISKSDYSSKLNKQGEE